MVTDLITLNPTKGMAIRRTRSSKNAAWTDNWKCAQGDQHICGGYSTDDLNQFQHLLQFTLPAWTDIEEVQKAELHVWSTNTHTGLVTRDSKGVANIRVAYLKHGFVEAGGGENVYTANLPDNDADPDTNYKAYGVVKPGPNNETVINVMPLIWAWAPASVNVVGKGKGKAKLNHGMQFTTAGSAPANRGHEYEAGSHKHPNTGLRPFLVLTVKRKGTAGITTVSSPSGDVPSGTGLFFTGEWEPGGRTGDTMYKVTLKFTAPGEQDILWIHWPTSNEVATSSFSVPDQGSLKSGITYAWTAKVHPSLGGETPYAAPGSTVRLTTTPPSLEVRGPSGSLPNLDSVLFTADYLVHAKQYRASELQVQLRTQLAETDPTWGEDLLWDSGWETVPLSTPDRTPAAADLTQTLSTLYGGPRLSNVAYSFRMRARDTFGGTSAWDYGGFTLTAPYIPPTDDDRTNLTRYGKEPPFRIRIYAVDLTAGKKRAPGKLLADLTDAANVGASEFYNSPGEFFFTLPAIHPQASVIEPYQCHFALELHTGQGWVGKAFGLITDFDATEDEVVFYGTDYLGLLARAVEERFNAVDAEMDIDKGGAKYSKKTVKDIIYDQLQAEMNKVNSPIGFISINKADIAAMPEVTTIYASFKQRLPFISGLIDSSRAGTGKRTRLVCERNADGTFRWRVLSNPGFSRENIRLEYGSLVQGFRTIPFSNWGTRVDAIGRTVLGTKVYSEMSIAPGINEGTWGVWPTATMYQDIDDLADLRRRSAQAASRVAKVGKMMGIGLRVGSLGVKDGWDITDSVTVDIKRGVVDTSRFGPDANGHSWWTIWGWTWSSSPDGHTGLVLSLAPREDSLPPNPDLIPGQPILNVPEWQLDTVPPTASDDGLYWLDTTTGAVYEKQDDGTWLQTGDMSGPPGEDGDPGPPGPPGTTGATGPPGADGATMYTWVKYADNASGGGISDSPTGKAYVGFAYNKTTPVESNNPADYAWSTNSGTTGPPGPPGPNGESLYTWVKYADTVTGLGMSDDPTGKPYIGLAYNKAVSTEGTNPGDYSWSLIQGPPGPTGSTGATGGPGPQGPAGSAGAQGPPGADGAPLYTWTKYADSAAGAGMSDSPTGKAYIGLAFNKVTPTESTNPLDYAWSLVLGPQGAPGSAGSTGPTGPSLYTWVKYADNVSGGGMSDDPTGKTYIGFSYNQTSPTEGTNPASYSWSLIQGPPGPTGPTGGTGGTGPQGPPGVDATRDTTAPPVPIFKVLPTPPTPNPNPTSAIVQQEDGTPAVAITAVVGYVSPPGGLTDLAYYVLQSTRFGAGGVPDWSLATQWMVRSADATGTADTTIVQPNAVAAVPYWLRVAAEDLSNNRSAYSSAVQMTTKGDPFGPPQPLDIVVGVGYQTIGVRWGVIPADDWSYVEVQWRIASPVGNWTSVEIAGTAFVIVGLTNGTAYDIRLRSVDRSGNTLDADGLTYKVADQAEKGWVTAGPATPTNIPGSSLYWDQIQVNTVLAGKVNADWVYTGSLKVGGGANMAAAITVVDSRGQEIGRWDGSGITITDPARTADGYAGNPNYRMRLDKNGLIITDVTLPDPLVSITPRGIDAASITFGSARGGHNLVQNSSFELGAFATSAVVKREWDVAADWNTSRLGSDTNVTTGASALSMTTI